MKKALFTFIFFISFSLLSAEDFFTDFLSIYNSYESLSSAYLYTQKLLEYNADGQLVSETPAKSIVFDKYEVSRIEQKKEPLYFLSTPAGYWIKNNKLKQPMKISGNYKVMDIQMQDILRLDFENDFVIEQKTDETVFLKRANKKSTYSFIKIMQNQNDYIAEIYDNKMQKIKTIKYICSNLNEVKSFTTIQIYDEFIASGSHYDYITLAQQKTSVSKILFNPIYINELIKLLDTL